MCEIEFWKEIVIPILSGGAIFAVLAIYMASLVRDIK
jgi:putative methionine-R-sulfoxide reductase with GAF domain